MSLRSSSSAAGTAPNERQPLGGGSSLAGVRDDPTRGLTFPLKPKKTDCHPSNAPSPNARWFQNCDEVVKRKTELKTLRLMNGIRVTTWEIGLNRGEKAEDAVRLPENCKRCILEFLPTVDMDYAVR